MAVNPCSCNARRTPEGKERTELERAHGSFCQPNGPWNCLVASRLVCWASSGLISSEKR